MDNNLNPFPPAPKKDIKPILVVFGTLLIIIAIGLYFLINRPKKTEEKKETSIKEVLSTPSPTPTPEIDKSKLKIQVLNGTGTPGQAGDVVKTLEKAGYKTENIKTGNAEKYDNKTTTIKTKKNFTNIADDLKKELKSSFDEIIIKSTNLDENEEFDIIITTGGKIYETPTPATTTTPTPTTTLSPTPTP